MTGLLTFVAAVLVFGGVVLVHELGHFIAARLNGIGVLEFAVGMGPAIFSRTVNGTKYSVRLLPLGGYNRMQSHEEEEYLREQGEEAPDVPDTIEPQLAPELAGESKGKYYEDVAPWRRILVLLAGPLMNFVLGFLLLCLLLSQVKAMASRQIALVQEGSAAAASGLQQDDVILAVNGHHCFVYNDVNYELERTANDSADFLVRRGGKKILLENVRFDRVTTEDGYSYMDVGFKVYGVQPNLLTVPKAAWNYTIFYAKLIYTSLVDLARGRESINNLSGPVGIVSTINQAVKMGWSEVLNLAILISINLGVFNLLPIPGLDGGQLVFTAAEWVLRRPLSPKLRSFVNFLGMAALILLMLFATWQDLLRMI